MINLPDRLSEIVCDELAPERQRWVIHKISTSLELIVGRRVAARMTDEQLDAFEKLVDAEDEAGASASLEKECPDYPSIVEQTVEEHLRVVAAALHIGLLDAS
jgi:DNA-binding GntR family transcriptional regulator